MPVVIPFAAGLAVGVCVAPSVRNHPKLQTVFVVIDAFQQTVRDAYRNAQQAAHELVNEHRSQLLRVFSPN